MFDVNILYSISYNICVNLLRLDGLYLKKILAAVC